MKKILFILSMVLVTGSASADDTGLKYAVHRFIQLYEAKDIQGIMAATSEDFSGCFYGSGSIDKPLLKKSLEFDFSLFDDIHFEIKDITLSENRVRLVWNVKYRYIPDDTVYSDTGHATRFTFRQVKNKWYLINQGGAPMLGRSDPVTGKFTTRSIISESIHESHKKKADEPRKKYVNNPLEGVASRPKKWASDLFVKKIPSVIEKIRQAYEQEDEGSLLEHISDNYRGENSKNKFLDKSDLGLSLQCDFMIFDNFNFQSVIVDEQRIFDGKKQVEIILLWDVRAQVKGFSRSATMRERRTRLVFSDENGVPMILKQDIQGYKNGTSLFGYSTPNQCSAILTDDDQSAWQGTKEIRAY